MKAVNMEQARYSEFPLEGALSEWIDAIWFIRQEGESRHYIIPDHTVELIFTSGCIIRSHPHNRSITEMSSHLAGLKTGPQHICIRAGGLGGIRFKPDGLHRFYRGDHSKLIDRSVEPKLIFGKKIHSLEQMIQESLQYNEDSKKIAAYIERYFSREAAAYEADPQLDDILSTIRSSHGNTAISDLARRAGCSVKTLERRMKARIGLTPKRYSRLYRFFRSVLALNPSVNKLSDVAYDMGFFDQMHFIREVKRFAGFTPKEILPLKAGIQAATLGAGGRKV